MKKIFLIALFLVCCKIKAQDIITDRPDQTESPFAVAPGIVQIESGFLFERYELGSSLAQHRNVYPTNLFRIGLAKRLELRIVNELVTYKTVNTATGQTLSTISGTEDMQIGFKYQLSDNDARLVIGLLAHAIVPNGSKGITNQLYGLFSRVNVSYDLDDTRNLSANFGYNNYELEFDNGELQKRQDGNFAYTFVYGHSISNRVGVYLEAFGEYLNLKDWGNNMDAGMTFLLKDNIQLDYSFGWGLNNVMNYHSVGISIRLPN